jgi:cysteine desulfurase/selenocysteine lyase
MSLSEIESIRNDFPILQRTDQKPFVYFDNAATTQKPQVVVDRIVEYYTNENASSHSVHSLASNLTQNIKKARETVKNFIKAKSDSEIIFTKSATESINLIANGINSILDLKSGDEILVSKMEHHANLLPWQKLAKDSGAELRFIDFKEDGELDLDSLETLINKRTKLICLVYISNLLGTINPIKEIIQKIRGLSNSLVLIDATQAVQNVDVDVQDLDTDFLVFSGHKIYGPTGVGIVYGKKNLLNLLQPYQLGGDMILEVSLKEAIFQETPYKFEAGTGNFSGILGLKTALDYFQELVLKKFVLSPESLALLKEVNFESDLKSEFNIFEYQDFLANYLKFRLKKIPGLKILGSSNKRIPTFSFIIENISPLDLDMYLDSKGIATRSGKHCVHPIYKELGYNSSLRVSLAFYNTIWEVNYFIQKLEKALLLFTN